MGSFTQEAWRSAENMIEINAPNVKIIGNNAFGNCDKLERIYFPSVEIVGGSAFRNCGNLINVFLPNATNIGDGSFNGSFNYCVSLERICLPKMTSIGFGAFSACLNLKFVSLGSGFTEPTEIITNQSFSFTYKNIDLCLGKNVLPLPDLENNTWNGYTWKSINGENCDVSVQEPPKINFTVSPNPAQDKLTIHHSKEIGNIGLYDLSGRLIRSKDALQCVSTVLDISDLDNGIYFLTVDGQTVKFIRHWSFITDIDS